MSVAPVILDSRGLPTVLAAARSAGGLFASAPARVDAPRIVRFSSGSDSYYDAATNAPDVDFGAWRSGHFEDLHFTGGTRRLVLARVRREVRNNPYLCGLVNKYPEAVGHTALRSRTSDRAYNLAKERFWYRWGKKATIDGRSLRKVEKLIIQELLLAGELFIVLLANGRLQLVASEFCGSPGDQTRFGEREVNGIVRDAAGNAIAYRFGRLTRWGGIEFSGRDDELVQARFVIHVFDPDRVLMGRGLPWLLSCIKSARDLYEICRSKTKQIKDANSLSGFITSQNATGLFGGMAPPPATEAAAVPETAESPADRPPPATPEGGLRLIELKPGMFFALNPGEQVQDLISEYHATDYKELIMLMLHAISSPVGLPVELWFSGLGDVNYSGFKGLGTQWKSRREYVQGFLEETFLEPLHTWRLGKAADEADIIDIKTGAPVTNPDQDEDLIQWGWKRAAVLDDEKAAKSNQIRLQTGESSIADIWADSGKFAEEEFEARRQLWIQMLIAAGELDAAGDHSKVKVPRGFLLKGELPGTTNYPALPDGTGAGEGGAAGANAPGSPAPTAPIPTKDDEEDDDEEREEERRAAA